MMNLRVFDSTVNNNLLGGSAGIATKLVNGIARAGIRDIGVNVNDDSEEAFFRGIGYSGPARSWVLVRNLIGLVKAKSWGARHFGLLPQASDEFSPGNTGCGWISEYYGHVPMLSEIAGEGLEARVYLTPCFGDNSGDDLEEDVVVDLATCFSSLKGKVVICDFEAQATPEKVDSLFKKLANENFEEGELSVDFHGSTELVMKNIAAAVKSPLVGTIDTSLRRCGGWPTGWCLPRSAPTQDVVAFLHERGRATDIDIAKLDKVDEAVASTLPPF